MTTLAVSNKLDIYEVSDSLWHIATLVPDQRKAFYPPEEKVEGMDTSADTENPNYFSLIRFYHDRDDWVALEHNPGRTPRELRQAIMEQLRLKRIGKQLVDIPSIEQYPTSNPGLYRTTETDGQLSIEFVGDTNPYLDPFPYFADVQEAEFFKIVFECHPMATYQRSDDPAIQTFKFGDYMIEYELNFEEVGQNSRIHYFLISLGSLDRADSNHATALVLDPVERTIEFFDSNGFTNGLEYIYTWLELLKIHLNERAVALKAERYLSQESYTNGESDDDPMDVVDCDIQPYVLVCSKDEPVCPQVFSKNDGDCAVWTFYYLWLRLNNQDVPRQVIYRHLHQTSFIKIRQINSFIYYEVERYVLFFRFPFCITSSIEEKKVDRPFWQGVAIATNILGKIIPNLPEVESSITQFRTGPYYFGRAVGYDQPDPVVYHDSNGTVYGLDDTIAIVGGLSYQRFLGGLREVYRMSVEFGDRCVIDRLDVVLLIYNQPHAITISKPERRFQLWETEYKSKIKENSV